MKEVIIFVAAFLFLTHGTTCAPSPDDLTNEVQQESSSTKSPGLTKDRASGADDPVDPNKTERTAVAPQAGAAEESVSTVTPATENIDDTTANIIETSTSDGKDDEIVVTDSQTQNAYKLDADKVRTVVQKVTDLMAFRLPIPIPILNVESIPSPMALDDAFWKTMAHLAPNNTFLKTLFESREVFLKNLYSSPYKLFKFT